MAKANTYDDSSIQILHGLEAVRKRPGMYIGSTDIHGLNQLVYEIVDNSVDEAMAGFGKEIDVTIHKDNSVTVRDLGRGMPTGMHKSGKPTIEVILTVLHAGGKFTEQNYKTSGGLHGVGSSVVNALSSYMKVRVVRDGKAYEEEFKNGGHPVGTLKCVGKTKDKTGTTITFKQMNVNQNIMMFSNMMTGLSHLFPTLMKEKEQSVTFSILKENKMAWKLNLLVNIVTAIQKI